MRTLYPNVLANDFGGRSLNLKNSPVGSAYTQWLASLTHLPFLPLLLFVDYKCEHLGHLAVKPTP